VTIPLGFYRRLRAPERKCLAAIYAALKASGTDEAVVPRRVFESLGTSPSRIKEAIDYLVGVDIVARCGDRAVPSGQLAHAYRLTTNGKAFVAALAGPLTDVFQVAAG
jgi:hypothetical protein